MCLPRLPVAVFTNRRDVSEETACRPAAVRLTGAAVPVITLAYLTMGLVTTVVVAGSLRVALGSPAPDTFAQAITKTAVLLGAHVALDKLLERIASGPIRRGVQMGAFMLGVLVALHLSS